MTNWRAEIQVTLHDEDAELDQVFTMFGKPCNFQCMNSPNAEITFQLKHDGDPRVAFAVALRTAAEIAQGHAES